MAGNLKKGFQYSHLTKELFQDILVKICNNAKLIRWSKKDINTAAFSKRITSTDSSQLSGLFIITLEYTEPPKFDQMQSTDIVFKSKVRGDELCSAITNPTFDKNIIDLFKEAFGLLGYTNGEYAELECVSSPALQPILPEIYWSCLDEDNGIFVYAMEYFNSENFTHISEMNTEGWNDEHITHVLAGLAHFHAIYFGITDAEITKDLKHLKHLNIRKGMLRLEWIPLFKESIRYHPGLLSQDDIALLRKICDKLPEINSVIERSPRTLVHFDVYPHNLCLRKTEDNNKMLLCLYDWETACFGPPQVDVASFLSSVLPLNATRSTWDRYINVYLTKLKEELINTCRVTSAKMEDCFRFEKFQAIFTACMIQDFMLSFAITGVMQFSLRDPEYLKRMLKMKMQYIGDFIDKLSFYDPCFRFQ